MSVTAKRRCCVVAVSGCVLLVAALVRFFWADYDPISLAAYQQIEIGMSILEVEAVLGKKTGEYGSRGWMALSVVEDRPWEGNYPG